MIYLIFYKIYRKTFQVEVKILKREINFLQKNNRQKHPKNKSRKKILNKTFYLFYLI